MIQEALQDLVVLRPKPSQLPGLCMSHKAPVFSSNHWRAARTAKGSIFFSLHPFLHIAKFS